MAVIDSPPHLACQKEALPRLALSFLALKVRGLTRILINILHGERPC